MVFHGKLVLIFGLTSQLAFGVLADDANENVSVEVMSHSFSSPFVYDSSRANWFLGGSAVGVSNVRSSLIMNPPIPVRHGIVLNTKRLECLNNFDATFTMHLDAGGMPRDSPNIGSGDQTFSLIMSSRNMTADLESSVFRSLKSDSPDLIDLLAKFSMDKRTMTPTAFDGVAVVISVSTPVSVSILFGDGRREVKIDDTGAPLFSTANNQPFAVDRLLYIRLRVRVTANSVTVYHQETSEWKKITEKTNIVVPKSGFIGMTSFSGNTPFRVRLSNFHLKSFDLAKVVADSPVLVALLASEPDLRDVEHKSLTSQSEQLLVINALIRVLRNHREAPVFESLRNSIISLQNKAIEMDEYLSVLAKEVKIVFSKNSSDSTLMSEIKGIHSVLSQSSAERDMLLHGVEVAAFEKLEDGSESVNRHLNHYQKQLSEHEEQLNEAIESNNRWTLILILLVFVAAIGMGAAFYVRLNRYANKAHLF